MLLAAAVVLVSPMSGVDFAIGTPTALEYAMLPVVARLLYDPGGNAGELFVRVSRDIFRVHRVRNSKPGQPGYRESFFWYST